MICATRCHGAGVAEFLLDTEVASRLMRAERKALTGLRRSGAKSVSISSITMAELLYGARASYSVGAAFRMGLPWRSQLSKSVMRSFYYEVARLGVAFLHQQRSFERGWIRVTEQFSSDLRLLWAL